MARGLYARSNSIATSIIYSVRTISFEVCDGGNRRKSGVPLRDAHRYSVRHAKVQH